MVHNRIIDSKPRRKVSRERKDRHYSDFDKILQVISAYACEIMLVQRESECV